MNGRPDFPRQRITRVSAGALCAALVGSWSPRPSHAAQLPKLAVFEFELDDSSATALPQGERPTDEALLASVTHDAQTTLAQSGRFSVVDASTVDSEAVKARTLHECDGCDAGLALRLGADQSLVGVVSRVSQIAYAVELMIRDAHNGKVLIMRRGVFLGGNREWSSGVTSLLRRMMKES